MKNSTDFYTLNNGITIPCIGFGTYKAATGDSADIIATAIEAGYRYFDTASFYGTEIYLAEAIKRSNLSREEFFITSKVWKDEMGYNETKDAFQRTLSNLNTDYLDLYLIHWPRKTLDGDWKQTCIDTWKAMEELYEEGLIKAIGLSNFLPHHMDVIFENCRIMPMVNQLEVHPGYTQEAAICYCNEHNILVQAWSPLGRQRVLQEPLILELAGKYHVTPAQICLRFLVQRGINVLPKASSMERMKNNMDIFSFSLKKEDMHRLNTLPQTGWSGEHPDFERVMID